MKKTEEDIKQLIEYYENSISACEQEIQDIKTKMKDSKSATLFAHDHRLLDRLKDNIKYLESKVNKSRLTLDIIKEYNILKEKARSNEDDGK